MNARFHFDWFLNKIIFYTGSLLRTKTLKSSNLTYFFSGVCVFECMIAEIHNSYVFNTFNEYQKEVFPIENTIVVCITRSISMQCFSLLQISIYISNVFIFTFPQHKNRILFPLFFQWILISLCRSNNKGKCNCVSFSLLLVVHTTIYFTMGASYLKKKMADLPVPIIL